MSDTAEVTLADVMALLRDLSRRVDELHRYVKANDARAGVFGMHYTVPDVMRRVGWSAKWWRNRIHAGELDLVIDGVLVKQPSFIDGIWLLPESCVTAFIARHERNKVRPYDEGVKARNLGELRRKMAARTLQDEHEEQEQNAA
jgi:hypothetical protein